METPEESAMKIVNRARSQIGSIALVLTALWVCLGVPQTALTTDPLERVQDAVVSMWQGNRCIGTGFLISSDGYILTNAHVVGERFKVGVRLSTGDQKEATVEKTVFQPQDQGKDLALLRIDANDLPFVKLGNSDQVRVPDPVTVIGFPQPAMLNIRG